MPTPDIVRYQPGMRIDPRKILEIIDLPPDKWGAIEAAYPEVKAAGPNTSFRGKHNVTIFPPEYVGTKFLKKIATWVVPPERHVYIYEKEGRILGVLVHIKGGYESVHIYRPRLK